MLKINFVRKSFFISVIGSLLAQPSLAEQSAETNSTQAVHNFFDGTTSLGLQLQFNLPELSSLENGQGFTLDISHEVSQKVFLDFGYTDSGDLDFDPLVSADSSTTTQGFLLGLRGYAQPRTHLKLNYYGKIGAFKGDEEATIAGVTSDGDSSTNYFVGFGAEKQFQDQDPLSIFAEITYYQDAVRSGGMTSFGLGVRWYFVEKTNK